MITVTARCVEAIHTSPQPGVAKFKFISARRTAALTTAKATAVRASARGILCGTHYPEMP